MSRALRIHPEDNVAVALRELKAGQRVEIASDAGAEELWTIQPVPFAHKVALTDLEQGDDIRKHGVPIGFARQAIRRGEWVHQHNTRSHFDALREEQR